MTPSPLIGYVFLAGLVLDFKKDIKQLVKRRDLDLKLFGRQKTGSVKLIS
jgi:hypothetical protein